MKLLAVFFIGLYTCNISNQVRELLSLKKFLQLFSLFLHIYTIFVDNIANLVLPLIHCKRSIRSFQLRIIIYFKGLILWFVILTIRNKIIPAFQCAQIIVGISILSTDRHVFLSTPTFCVSFFPSGFTRSFEMQLYISVNKQTKISRIK
jgi:hypothetical protein